MNIFSTYTQSLASSYQVATFQTLPHAPRRARRTPRFKGLGRAIVGTLGRAAAQGLAVGTSLIKAGLHIVKGGTDRPSPISLTLSSERPAFS